MIYPNKRESEQILRALAAKAGIAEPELSDGGLRLNIQGHVAAKKFGFRHLAGRTYMLAGTKFDISSGSDYCYVFVLETPICSAVQDCKDFLRFLREKGFTVYYRTMQDETSVTFYKDGYYGGLGERLMQVAQDLSDYGFRYISARSIVEKKTVRGNTIRIDMMGKLFDVDFNSHP